MSKHPPLGFTFAGVAAGIKKTGRSDLALIVSDRPCSAAATFTRNAFPAAPVLYDRALVAENAAGLRAVAINAGCANACTGEAGLADAAEMARLAEAALGLPPRSAAVMSTGVIGPRLPMDKIAAGIQQAAGELSPDGWDAAAHAIMTTDTRPKIAFREIGGARIFGMCKGAGMIHPNMATMLADDRHRRRDRARAPGRDAAPGRGRQLQLHQRRRRHVHERHGAAAGERRAARLEVGSSEARTSPQPLPQP